MESVNVARLIILTVVGAIILRAYLWRAILFVKPDGMRVEADAPADQAKVPAALAAREAELLAAGFVRLGSHLERPLLGRSQVSFDYGHPEERAFATLFSSRDQARLYFFTPTEGGGFVITADHRRPARELPGRYLSGGIDEAPAERVFKAHQRRVSTVGTPKTPVTHEARLEAARAWYRGEGKHEVRQQNALGLLWTVGTLGMVGALLASLFG